MSSKYLEYLRPYQDSVQQMKISREWEFLQDCIPILDLIAQNSLEFSSKCIYDTH